MAKKSDVNFPLLKNLFKKWEELKGAKIAPSRNDITLAGFKPWLGHLNIIAVKDDPLRFFIRLNGTINADTLSFDSTGKYYDEIIQPVVYQPFIIPFLNAIKSKRPNYQTGRYEESPTRKRIFYRMVLPLSNNGTSIDMLLLAFYIKKNDNFAIDRKNFKNALISGEPISL